MSSWQCYFDVNNLLQTLRKSQNPMAGKVTLPSAKTSPPTSDGELGRQCLLFLSNILMYVSHTFHHVYNEGRSPEKGSKTYVFLSRLHKFAVMSLLCTMISTHHSNQPSSIFYRPSVSKSCQKKSSKPSIILPRHRIWQCCSSSSGHQGHCTSGRSSERENIPASFRS